LLFALLATGAIAAIALSTARGPVTMRIGTTTPDGTLSGASDLSTVDVGPGATLDPGARHRLGTPGFPRSPTGPGEDSTPSPRTGQRLGPNLGAGPGIVSDHTRPGPGGLNESHGGAAQDFQGGGVDGKQVSDPTHGGVPVAGGGGGGGGGGASSGGNSNGGTASSSSSSTSSGGSSGGTSGGNTATGGSSGGTPDGTTTSSGSSSSGGNTGTTSSGGHDSQPHDRDPGNHDGGKHHGGGGKDGGNDRDHDPRPGDLIGTDDHGGGAIDVPEPDTIGLLGLGILGLALSRSRRLRQRLARGANRATADEPLDLSATDEATGEPPVQE
ncbi:MAG: PEP-CTERM sorting domain-containing protein, partial [Sphingomonadales bacterium]|nr:PEP-CTERM sorting domain-containing protein [Sphingomonadales bacterium]